MTCLHISTCMTRHPAAHQNESHCDSCDGGTPHSSPSYCEQVISPFVHWHYTTHAGNGGQRSATWLEFPLFPKIRTNPTSKFSICLGWLVLSSVRAQLEVSFLIHFTWQAGCMESCDDLHVPATGYVLFMCCQFIQWWVEIIVFWQSLSLCWGCIYISLS